MDQVFSTANSVWNFFKNLLDLEAYSEMVGGGLLIGLAVVGIVAMVLVLKSRRSKVEKRRQLEELEEALLDEDDEAHGLNLPESLSPDELYADYPDEETEILDTDDLESIPEPLRMTLARDPEFGGQIVISAQSQRKQAPEEETEDTEHEAESPMMDIEQEFAQFAQELKDKQREVQLRHRLEEDLFEESHYQEDVPEEAAPEPFSLSASDIIEDDDFAEDWSTDLDDLLETPVASPEEDVSNADLLAEAEEERRRKNERIIQRLEELERDLEHRFQSGRLSKLAQKNFELVESLGDTEQAKEYQEMKRKQTDRLSALENMVFGLGKKKK